jgi:mRNA-degrading endonuclease HigB of HigAB toxin-antitoxin module
MDVFGLSKLNEIKIYDNYSIFKVHEKKYEVANPYLSLRVYVKCLDTHENSEVLIQNVRMSVPAFRRIPF